MVRSQTLALAILFASMAAMAQESGGERYTLKRDVDFSGHIFPHSTGASAEGAIPFDKSYGELTAAQQSRFKLFYVALGEGDEPPFPLQGLGTLFDP